jgi:FkbM family methyltransferase
MRNILKKIIPTLFKKRLRDQLGVPSQEMSFKNLKVLGFEPKRCLDIGAYEGGWAIDFKNIFPQCAILMIEGQQEKESKLADVKGKYADVDYCIALMGAQQEEVVFHKYETASSVLSEHNVTNAKTERRLLCTLDDLIDRRSFFPDFIKIDTQGYELEILKGGKNAVSTAEFILLEVSFLDIYQDCPLVHEVINYMHENGFVTYDICTLMKRPLDKALYQADILFTRSGSRFRKNKRWS